MLFFLFASDLISCCSCGHRPRNIFFLRFSGVGGIVVVDVAGVVVIVDVAGVVVVVVGIGFVVDIGVVVGGGGGVVIDVVDAAVRAKKVGQSGAAAAKGRRFDSPKRSEVTSYGGSPLRGFGSSGQSTGSSGSAYGDSANKKRAPLTTLNGASASKKKARVEAQPTSFPSPPTFLPPISETEPPQTSCLPMEPPEPEPPAETVVETVQISSSPEADPPASIQTFLLGASDVQEEVLHPEIEVVVVAYEDIEVAAAPATTSSIGPILEVAPALTQLDASPLPVREVTPVIQEVVTLLPLPTPPVPASIATPLEAGHDVTNLQDYTQKLQVLTEVESLAREKTSRISKDLTESEAREALDVLSSKLDNAKVTLDETAEDLSQAKLDEEDAHKRLELAREQAQSADTKVIYLATEVEQIRESVRELKEVVLEAMQKVEEVIALPTLSAAEKANLLSLRAAFARSQQELVKDL
ncbi:hypothetical protein H6P81_002562 [Aristolochia fimbriata]|uniref:Uncharacterized protein n=1 Tax=Aristolochia fimbriata TaxID=158543 RepID=A0AAV7FAP1_ARIFI|nr:hypothetical protein H6P81_002562 [Aristolochia fimbriata]